MSIQANFAEWCRLQGVNPKPAAYMDEGIADLREGDARIVRMVDRRSRAGARVNQRYVVEQMINDTISYPFGQQPMGKKQLLAAMISATIQRSQR